MSDLFAAMSNYNATGTIDDFKVPDEDLSAVQAAIVCFDSFTDTNGTSLDAHTMDHGGLTWTERDGNFDIQGNQANAGGTPTVRHIATVNMGISDVIIDAHCIPASANGYDGIIMRYSDNNNLWLGQWAHSTDDLVRLYERNGGTWILRASTALVPSVDGEEFDIRGICDGQTIDIFVNGGSKTSYASASLNETETNYGISPNEVGGKVDNFTIFPRTSSTYNSVLNGV